jgi:DNA-directed RNA polymerase subunit H (RpoH/RPB5)
MSSNRNQVSANGYTTDLLKSGLQQYICSGNTEKALYCVGELGLFKEENIRAQLIQRLMVIFMEDIENLSIAHNIHQTLNEIKSETEERQCSEIVIQLCASSKSRVCSHLRAVFNPKYTSIREKYPSLMPVWQQIEENKSFEELCALFTACLKEKKLLAVYYGFQIEASDQKLKKRFQGRSQPVWYMFQEMLSTNVPYTELFMDWYKSHVGTIKEGFLCWLLPLLHYMDIIPSGDQPVSKTYPLTWDANRSGVKMELNVPKGRGKYPLENEASFVNPLWKLFYEDGQRMEEGVPILTESALHAATQQGGTIPTSSKSEKKRGPKIAKSNMEKEPTSVVEENIIVSQPAQVTQPTHAAQVAQVTQVAPVQKDKIKPEITISKMNDSFVLIDNIYRSRMTLLDILEARGYQVDNYRKFSPAEATAAASSITSLNFTVIKKNDPKTKCEIRYANVISRPKLETYFDDILDEDSENTEVVVMSYSPVMDAHHQVAFKQYSKYKEEPNEKGEKLRRKLRVSFFCIDMLVVNPLKHVLVPKHELVPEELHKDLMTSMYITAKSKFPEIKFHADPIARCIGVVPGDIVKITRPSQSSGETIIYRVCAI